MKKLSRMFSLIMTLVLVLAIVAGCGANGGNDATGQNGQDNDAGNSLPLAGKKIALVMQQNLGTFSAQYIDGVRSEVEAFGGEVTVMASDGDLGKMASNLDAAVNQHVDGILLDHGTAEALQAGAQKAVDKGIPVIAFDSTLQLAGVTTLEQADQKMAEMTLERLAKDINGQGNIVKIWVAGFAPMERRQIAYEAFLKKYPDIKEIASFGAATANTALDTQAQMEAILKQYPKGQISAVWAAWDEFAKGAARAIQQAGRTEIKLYGIDMSDEDLQMIQDDSNPWIASAAVDPKDIGRVQVRFLYQRFHGDQVPDTIVLEPVFVQREDLPDKQINTSELAQYVKGWGSSNQGYADWMDEYLKK
ncbi:MAG TPA: sugar ABC transporter substrate-binding protein [Bacilli bacterium]